METNTTATNTATIETPAAEPTAQSTEATVATTEVAVTPAAKPIRYTIYQDSNGNEIHRTVSGRGRPPLGSILDTEGNRIVKNATMVDGKIVLANAKPERKEVYYITVDDNGKEVSRKLKQRGRNTPGFVLHTQGAFAGHFVGKPMPKAVKPAKVATAATVEAASETEVTVPTEVVDQSEEKVTGACPHLSAM